MNEGRARVNRVPRLNEVEAYVEWVLRLPEPRTASERKIWHAYRLGKEAAR